MPIPAPKTSSAGSPAPSPAPSPAATLAATLAAALVIGAAACSPGTPLPPPPDLVLTNVRVVDVEAGVALEPGTVTIRDGRIESIVPGAGPVAATGNDAGHSLDGGGGYLVPGLWDMHVHFRGGPELEAANRDLLPLYVANGVTTVRDGGGDLTASILRWRDEIDLRARVGPRILTSGPKLDGPTGGWDGSLRLEEPGEVPAALDSLEALGVDYVKLYDGTMSGEVFLAAVAEARRRGLVVTGHMPYTVRFSDAVAAGLSGTEHLYYAFKGGAMNEDSVTTAMIEGQRPGAPRPLGFWGALSLLIPAFDEARAAEGYRAMAEAGTAAIPTLHIMRTLSYVDEVDHAADPELRYIHPDIEATYAGRVQSARRSSEAARAERRELESRFVEMIRPMRDAGVTILAGSDAGPFNSYVYPGFSLHDELEALVAAGLTPAEALRAATLESARFMGLDAEVGRVAEGFRADLVLLEANPLDAIGNTRSIRAVVLNGREVLEAPALEAMLEAVAR